MRRGQTRSTLNELSTASFSIDLGDGPVDLTAGVQILTSSPETAMGDGLQPIFTGNTTSAKPSGGLLHVEAGSGRGLVEGQVGILHVAGDVALDTVYMLCKQAGQEVDIEGMEAAKEEVFAIEMPLGGVSLPQATRGMGVELLPLSRPGEREFEPFTAAIDQITERWGRPTARARTYVIGKHMYDAELIAIRKIESVVDALIATAGYGFSCDPWGRDLPFDRRHSMARPSVLPVVYSQGLTTGRRWLHDPGGQQDGTLDIGVSFTRWAEVLREEPPGDVSLGLRALRDAAEEGREVSERCHALCTVLEYYAAGSRPTPVVSKAVMTQVKRALTAIEMTAAERNRLQEHVGQVNSPPLLARVRHQVQRDKTPMNEDEWSLIAKIRRNRNDSVHGRLEAGEKLTAEDLRWGVSVASRLLLYRWVGSGVPGAEPSSKGSGNSGSR